MISATGEASFAPPGRPTAGVLLVTSDAELRELVSSRCPPDVILTCRDSQEPITGSYQQVWIDLDGVSDPRVAQSGHNVSCIFFGNEVAGVVSVVPASMVIRKPCTAERIDRLWAGVSPPGEAGEVARPAESLPGALGWLISLLELDLRSLAQRMCVLLPEGLGYANGSLYVYDRESQVLRLAACNHQRPLDHAVPMDTASDSLMACVARLGRTREVDTVGHLRAELGLDAGARHVYASESCLIAPLISHEQLWGVANLSGRLPNATRPDDSTREFILTFAARALENAVLHERVQTEARVDGLTGLQNRRGIYEALTREIGRAQRYGGSLSLLLLDLDGLKHVNDCYGHAAGDAVLRHVANRISSVLRQFDSAARLGGDEFLIMLPSTGLAGAWHVAQRLLAGIRSDAAVYEDRSLPVTASIGAAEWSPGWDACRLVDVADRAMYCAKVAGGDRVTGQSTAVPGARQTPAGTPSVRGRPPARRAARKP